MRLIEFALGNLRRRPARTTLTVSAIALGIAAVVALTSIAWGFEASWQEANDTRGTDLIVTRTGSENAMPSAYRAGDLKATLSGYPRVRSVVGLLSEMLSVSEDAPPMFVFGWEFHSYLWDHLRLKEGHWPDTDSESTVFLGALAAGLLHKKSGDSLEVAGHPFRVGGIFESSAVVENGALLMTLTQAQQITDKPGKVNVLNLKLDGGASEADFESIRARVRETLPGYVAITSGELVSRNAVVRISKAMSNATILIAGLVGALVVFNTMLMSINERTREFGILLAVGWQPRTIAKLVVGESTLLSLSGGALGILLGIAIAAVLEHLDLLRGKIVPVFSLSFCIGVLLLSVLLGIAGGLYPALKASRLRPSEALRQE